MIKHTVSYRSGLEERIGTQLQEAGITAEYEGGKVSYMTPAKAHKYTWDFKLPNGIIIESKGIFDATDRAKHMLIRQQHPELDIRFIFSYSKSKLYKGSPTTYAAWCNKNGFLFADKLIPPAWLTETKQ